MYNVKMDYVYTQQYIWETLGQSNAIFRDSSIQRGYESFKASINQKIADMDKRPSFDATTIELDAGRRTADAGYFRPSDGIPGNISGG